MTSAKALLVQVVGGTLPERVVLRTVGAVNV